MHNALCLRTLYQATSLLGGKSIAEGDCGERENRQSYTESDRDMQAEITSVGSRFKKHVGNVYRCRAGHAID